MKERLPLLAALILVLAVIGVYLNLSLVRPSLQYPGWMQRWLSWQGEPAQRSFALREGLDLQGGLQVLMQVSQQSVSKMQAGDLERAASIIETRVNALGVTEPLVQTQGSDKIVVELPGVADPELAKRTIGQTAELEFIYGAPPAGQPPLRPGDKVYTTWSAEGKLFDQLSDPEKKVFQKAMTETQQAGQPVGGTPAGSATATGAAPAATGTRVAAAATQAVTGTLAITGTASSEVAARATRAVTATAGPAATSVEPAATASLTATLAVTGTAAAPAAGAMATVTGTGAVTGTAGITGTAGAKTEWVYPTIITGEYLSQASVGLDQFNKPAVSFVLNADGGSRMQRFTSGHIGEVMAIALDGVLISVPTVRETIADNGQISGNFTRTEAESLVAQLRSGALPVALDIVGETRIGPTLGRQSVHDAVKGGLVGMLVIVVFMLVYYRFPGFLADIALMLYVLLVLSVFRLIPVTLTLAGIAGFILSIGIAVDANILIFERLKEELRAGRRVRAAMDAGFARAWPSIRDSNFSTLITCVILFWFGSQFGASIVQGFAVTLSLGVIISLFTAITVTRTLLLLSNRFILRETDEGAAADSTRLRRLFGF